MKCVELEHRLEVNSECGVVASPGSDYYKRSTLLSCRDHGAAPVYAVNGHEGSHGVAGIVSLSMRLIRVVLWLLCVM